MALPSIERRKTGGSPGRQQPTVRFDCPAQLRYVVAEHFAKAARLEKVALHVDDQERAVPGGEREGIGISLKLYCLGHSLTPALGRRGRKCTGSPRREITAFMLDHEIAWRLLHRSASRRSDVLGGLRRQKDLDLGLVAARTRREETC
jgi:hypothetical protein